MPFSPRAVASAVTFAAVATSVAVVLAIAVGATPGSPAPASPGGELTSAYRLVSAPSTATVSPGGRPRSHPPTGFGGGSGGADAGWGVLATVVVGAVAAVNVRRRRRAGRRPPARR